MIAEGRLKSVQTLNRMGKAFASQPSAIQIKNTQFSLFKKAIRRFPPASFREHFR